MLFVLTTPAIIVDTSPLSVVSQASGTAYHATTDVQLMVLAVDQDETSRRQRTERRQRRRRQREEQRRLRHLVVTTTQNAIASSAHTTLPVSSDDTSSAQRPNQNNASPPPSLVLQKPVSQANRRQTSAKQSPSKRRGKLKVGKCARAPSYTDPQEVPMLELNASNVLTPFQGAAATGAAADSYVSSDRSLIEELEVMHSRWRVMPSTSYAASDLADWSHCHEPSVYVPMVTSAAACSDSESDVSYGEITVQVHR